jgi:sugar phosphate permease
MTRRERRILAAAFATQAAAVGSTFGCFSLFVLPVAQEFGASRASVALGAALISGMLGISGIFVGTLFDRGNARRVMATGALLQPACLIAASQSQSLALMAGLCMIAGALMPTVGPLASASVVGKTFAENRGRALGLVNTGVSVGGMLFSLLASAILARHGWRATLLSFGLIAMSIMVPAVWLGIPSSVAPENTPKPAPGGTAMPNTSARVGAAPAQAATWTPASLFRLPEFYACALTLGVGAGLASGWGAHNAAFFQDHGATTAAAARVVAIAQGLAIPGALLLGRLADRRGARNLLVAQLGVQSLGFLLYRSEPPLLAMFAIAAVMGLASGGLVPVYTQLVVQRFGPLSLGRVMGLSNLFLLPVGVGMPPFVGFLYDRFGSYATAHLIFVGFLALPIAALLAFVSSRPAQPASGAH